MWSDNETDVDLLGFDFLLDSLNFVLSEPKLLPMTAGVLGDLGARQEQSDEAGLRRFSAPIPGMTPATSGATCVQPVRGAFRSRGRV